MGSSFFFDESNIFDQKINKRNIVMPG